MTNLHEGVEKVRWCKALRSHRASGTRSPPVERRGTYHGRAAPRRPPVKPPLTGGRRVPLAVKTGYFLVPW